MKKVVNQVWTLGIVTAVTLLVWLYAEDANIEEYTEQSVRVQFVIPQGVNGLAGPTVPITLQVDFNGSNGQYQQFANLTRDGAIEVPMPLTFKEEFETKNVNTLQLLEERLLRDLGINITAVRPVTVPVRFERYVDVPIKLAPIQSGGLGLAEPPQIVNNIRQVTVNVLAGRKIELAGAIATLDLRKADLAGLPKGEPRQIRLPVILPESMAGLTPKPATVDLIVTLADDRGRVVIDSLPILLSNPASINENYIVTIERTDRILTNIELEGPRAVIEQIKADPTPPRLWATIRLTNDEAGAAADGDGVLSKKVDIIAPAGVTATSDVKLVTVRVTRRETPVTP